MRLKNIKYRIAVIYGRGWGVGEVRCLRRVLMGFVILFFKWFVFIILFFVFVYRMSL